jgi:tRNA(fMet)-specific endonuclease VapC
MLDTNIAIHIGNGTASVLEKLESTKGTVVLSALSLAELQRGIYKHAIHTALRQARFAVITRNIPILPFTAEAAERYGQIIAQCGWAAGRDVDRMIAAHALTAGAILVTNNTKDFADIPGLHHENWTLN